jgi:hypothetical protein
VRQRKVTDSAVVDPRQSREHRLSDGATNIRRELGGAGAADVPEEALEEAEVGIPGRAENYAVLLQIDAAADFQLRAFADQFEPPHCVLADERTAADHDRFLVERKPQRAVVTQPVVEQRGLELLDRNVDLQMLRHVQFPGNPDRAAGHRGGEWREFGHERADIRIERRVGKPKRHFGIHLVGQLDLTRARHRETRRGGFDLERQQITADAEATGYLPDALLPRVKVGDAEPDIVPRCLEGAIAGRTELQQAGQRRPREGEALQRLDRNPTPVGVEGVGAVPAHPGRPGRDACALLDGDAVETHARAFEAEPRRRFLERLVVRDAFVDLQPAVPVGALV